MGTVNTIIHEELKIRKISAKFVSRVLREDQKERHCHDSREMAELINSDPTVLDESWIYCYDPETKRLSSQWKHAGSPRPKKARQSKSTHKLLLILFFDSTGMIYMHCVPIGQTDNKEYYVKVLREFSKRFLQKRPALFKSGQWHFHQAMHQSTIPSLSQTIWPRWASRQFLTLPIFPKLKKKFRGCCYETIEEMKEAVTKVIDTLTPEDFHGAFDKLLEWYNKCIAARGDYFEGD